MKKQRYYPIRQGDQVVWLSNFCNQLTLHAEALLLNAEWVTAVIKDARWVAYLLGHYLPSVRTHAKAATAALKLAESGKKPILALAPTLALPELPEGVEPRLQGALTRVFEAVQKIKSNPRYNKTYGTSFGIIGPEETRPDYGTLAPKLRLTVLPNQVRIRWSWQGCAKFLDMIEIQVDRGAGWELLTYDVRPGYTDNHPHPATVAQWLYRAIYRVDDARVGQWSALARANVGGG